MIVSCCCKGAMLVGHLMCVTGWRHGWRTKRSTVVVEGREWWPRAGESAGALGTWSGASSNTLAESDGVQVMPGRRASSQQPKLRSTSLGWSRRTRSISCYACGIPSTSSKKCAACKIMRYWCGPPPPPYMLLAWYIWHSYERVLHCHRVPADIKQREGCFTRGLCLVWSEKTGVHLYCIYFWQTGFVLGAYIGPLGQVRHSLNLTTPSLSVSESWPNHGAPTVLTWRVT